MNRRHSIAVGSSTNPKQPEKRRGSFQSNLNKSMSAGLNLLQRKLSRENFYLGESETCLDKALVQAALVSHYRDDTIKVNKLKRNSRGSIEILTNGIAQECGRKRVDVILKSINVQDEDRESYVQRTLLSDIKKFLIESQASSEHILRIAKHFIVQTIDVPDEDMVSATGKKFLILIEDVKYLGFKETIIQDIEGLDYEHSVLVISAMARFHAASYCFRKIQKIDLTAKYPALSSEIEPPKLSKETILILEEIFKQNPEYCKYSGLFMGPVNGNLDAMNNNLESFGVLSHGNFTKQNIVFKYKSAIDSKLFCSDVIFQDLSQCHYGSCVLDLLQFIFVSIDHKVRHSFMPDFVCSVYYDNFAKTVSSIDQRTPVFSKKSFIKEFDHQIMYGFLFAVKTSSDNYEKLCEKFKERSVVPSHKRNVLGIMRDVIQFKLNTRVTLNTDAKLNVSRSRELTVF